MGGGGAGTASAGFLVKDRTNQYLKWYFILKIVSLGDKGLAGEQP